MDEEYRKQIQEFTEEEVRDLLARFDIPVEPWQLRLMTHVLNYKGPIRLHRARRY